MKKALFLSDQIKATRIQCVTEDVIRLLDREAEWFSMNQILLPHTFVENWRTLRVSLRQLKRKVQHEGTMDVGPDRKQRDQEILVLESFLDNLADEMEECIRKELGLKKVCIKKPDYKK